MNISKDDTENREKFWKLPKKSRFKSVLLKNGDFNAYN